MIRSLRASDRQLGHLATRIESGACRGSGIPFFAAFALFGRWILLYPTKLIPSGMFSGRDSFGAKVARVQVAFVGTFAVWGGTWGALTMAITLVTPWEAWMHFVATATGCIAGVIAAALVHRERKVRAPHRSEHPLGWWP